MTTPQPNIHDVLMSGQAAAATAQAELQDRPTRSEMRRTTLAVAIVVALLAAAVAITVSLLAFSSANAANVRQAGVEQSNADNHKLAQQAFDAAKDANAVLSSRGQAPVPVPSPDFNDATGTIVAAATARVLASIDTHPSAAQLGQAIADYLVANPITPAGPAPGSIAAAVGAYLAVNPPAPGEQGETGETGPEGAPGKDGADGHTPTAQEIQDAFVAYVTAHPDVIRIALCGTGQDFQTAKELVGADGTRYTLFGCIISTTAAAPTSTISTTGTN